MLPESEPTEEAFAKHLHAPPHLFRAGATYFVTARTRGGHPILASLQRRQELLDALRHACEQRGWTRVAWVVLPEHYHCILRAPGGDNPELDRLFASVHRFTARAWNHADRRQGRQVWYQYWDTCLSSPGAFFARVNYIHWNPVRHGLVREPGEYPFSSYARWRALEEVDLYEVEGTHPWDWLDLERTGG